MIVSGQTVITANGEKKPLKDILTYLSDKGTGDNKDGLQLIRVMDKLENTDKPKLDEAELKLLRKCMDKQPLLPMVYGCLLLHLWPGELADSDKEIIEGNLKGAG